MQQFCHLKVQYLLYMLFMIFANIFSPKPKKYPSLHCETREYCPYL